MDTKELNAGVAAFDNAVADYKKILAKQTDYTEQIKAARQAVQDAQKNVRGIAAGLGRAEGLSLRGRPVGSVNKPRKKDGPKGSKGLKD